MAAGYATEREVDQRDRPDKRLYRATPEGERAMREWLEGSEVEPDEIRSPFLVKVFFGHLMDPASLAAQVEERRAQARALLAQFRDMEQRIDREGEFFPYLALRSGLAHTRATIRWADEVLRELEARGGADDDRGDEGRGRGQRR